MTEGVQTVDATADVADIARLFVHDQLRSLPVVEGERLVGIVSRRDGLRTLVRPDEEIRRDLLRLVEGYTGETDAWSVSIVDGVATVQRARGAAQPSPAGEERPLTALATTVGGAVGFRLPPRRTARRPPRHNRRPPTPEERR
jgi:CBS domain-containing protein